MKKIVLAVMMAPVVAVAQNYNSGISVSDIAMTGGGKDVLLEMTLDIEYDAVTKLQGIAVVPFLSDGTDHTDFPYVLVNGANRNRIFERQVRFRNTGIMRNPPLEVMVIDRKHRGGKIEYSARIAARPWMENAGLSLRFVLISPAGKRRYYTAAVSGISAVAAVPVPAIESMPEPAVETEPIPPVRKTHSAEGTAYLDFKEGSSMLMIDHRRNPEELDAIREAMAEATLTAGTKIATLEITGYSSPDGRFDANETLARERAHQLAMYLQDIYRIPPGISTVHTAGEDWDGLRKMVASSDMPYRMSVLEIIDSREHPDAKESRLRRMAGGQVWQMLTDRFFPGLRRVEYKIDYEVTE